jgi:general nucleoside transport system ATP-binding protein
MSSAVRAVAAAQSRVIPRPQGAVRASPSATFSVSESAGTSPSVVRTAELIDDLGVKTEGPASAAATLSGGNQQKLLIGRALALEPLVLVAENPTRGLDVQATRAVHDRLREAAARGLAVLVYSSDLDEVLTLGTRVVVMHRGQLVEAPPGTSREAIGRMMLGAGNG